MAKRKFGEAQVEVSIRDRVGAGLKAIEKRMKQFGVGVAAVGGAISAAGTAGVAAFSAIAAEFSAYGDSVEKMAARTGVSAEALSTLGFAAGQSGTSIETVEKAQLYQALSAATSACKTKAPYGKGEHSFKLLASIDPSKVVAAAPWAKRFVDETKRQMGC